MVAIRRPGTASAATLVGLCAALAAAHLLAPGWCRRAGLDVWNYPALVADREAADDERGEVEAKAERCARRRAAADQSAARLVTGDVPLAAVAADLLALFAAEPGSVSALGMYNPEVRDPRLLYARHAIFRACRLLAADPAREAAVRARLEAEYRVLDAEWGAGH